jgi:hypothetical protein
MDTKIEAHRHLAAAWLVWARRQVKPPIGGKPRKVSPWDLCVLAGTKARAKGHLGAYEQIKAVAIKFPPTANYYLGEVWQ